RVLRERWGRDGGAEHARGSRAKWDKTGTRVHCGQPLRRPFVSEAAAEADIRGAAHESRTGNLLRGREAPDARSEVRNREHPRGIPALTSVLLHWFAKRLHLEPGTPPL